MEPNNFEKDFREKLNKRTIEPGDKAWDRLDAMLSFTEKKKAKKKNKWLYAAASFIGLLLVGTFFFNQNESKTEIPTNTIVIKEVQKKDSVVKPALNLIDSAGTKVVVAEKPTIQKVNKEEEKIFNQKSNKTIKKESNQIAESSVIIKNNQEKQTINNQTSVVETSKKSTVEELLNAAEKTVVAENSAKPKSKVKVNASDLLHQVDGELELSFREKVISKVNKNYQTVKVALANRNQEE